MLRVGAKVDATTTASKRTPLLTLASAIMLRHAMQSGSAKDVAPGHGLIELPSARACGRIAELLLDEGADPDARDSSGRAALMYVAAAASVGSAGGAVLMRLIAHGSSANQGEEGVDGGGGRGGAGAGGGSGAGAGGGGGGGRPARRRADLWAVDPDTGGSALHVAAAHGSVLAIRQLLDARREEEEEAQAGERQGADPFSVRDRDGHTPATLAVSRGWFCFGQGALDAEQARRFYGSGASSSGQKRTFKLALVAGEHNNGDLRRLLMKGFAASGNVLSCDLATVSIGERTTPPSTSTAPSAAPGSGPTTPAKPQAGQGAHTSEYSPARLAASGSLARAAMTAAAAAAEGAAVIEPLANSSPTGSTHDGAEGDTHEVVLVEYEDAAGVGAEVLHENLVRFFFQAVDPTRTTRAKGDGAKADGTGTDEDEGGAEDGSDATSPSSLRDAATPPLAHHAPNLEADDGPPKLVAQSGGLASTPVRGGTGHSRASKESCFP